MSMLGGALSAIFWGVLTLSILVFVHEGGHYVAARAFGVRVTEFFLGLPCRFKLSHKSKKHGTEVGITPFLLGGYNRICGMEGDSDELLASAFAIVQREGRVTAEAVAQELNIDLERSYALLVNLSDAAAIRPYYDPELGERPSQKDYPASFETMARDANMLTEYDDKHDFSLEGFTEAGAPRPLTNASAQLEADEAHTYRGLSVPKRIVVLVAGPLVNIVLAFILTTGVIMARGVEFYYNENTVGEITAGSLAEKAGLEEGDKIIRIGDTEVTDWNGIADALDSYREAGQDFPIVYMRDGSEATTTIDLPEGEKVDLIGVSAKTEVYHPTFFEAAQSAVQYAGMVLQVVAKLIMPQHTMEVLDQSSSVVGISVQASQAASSGLVDLVALMAAISMSLGFMNLLPIPPLDGGKILIELIQLCIRRPLSIKTQNAISYVGLAFFMFVFVVVVRNDVLRFIVG